ncbi:MAG: hypothetical protein CVT73_21780, partial [Alphaproteobacteria bacterium HGW-Alphaproteobacteria-12]
MIAGLRAVQTCGRDEGNEVRAVPFFSFSFFSRVSLLACAASIALAGAAWAAQATLMGGTVTLHEGETASFAIKGVPGGPADLHAECR